MRDDIDVEDAPGAPGPHLEPGSATGPGADRPGVSSVGHREVDAVLERLEELDALETTEHPEVYEDAHSRLHQTLVAAGRDDPGPEAEFA